MYVQLMNIYILKSSFACGECFYYYFFTTTRFLLSNFKSTANVLKEKEYTFQANRINTINT